MRVTPPREEPTGLPVPRTSQGIHRVTFRRADEGEMTSSTYGAVNGGAPAIEVNGLDKRFGDVHAVRAVNFEVATGEVFGFLGPNGAGKTTTINMLCTLAKPTAGAAKVAGHDVARGRDDGRRNLGRVVQDQ